MLVAVGVDEFGMITAHLGKTNRFFIYKIENNVAEMIDDRAAEGDKSNHRIEEIKDCTAVIAGGIGGGMSDGLKMSNITPVLERRIIKPDEAIKKHFIN